MTNTYNIVIKEVVNVFIDRFPWKLTIHLLLIVFTTMQVLLTLQGQSDIARSQERAFGRYFFDENENFDQVDHQRVRNFYDIPSFRLFVKSSLDVINNTYHSFYRTSTP